MGEFLNIRRIVYEWTQRVPSMTNYRYTAIVSCYEDCEGDAYFEMAVYSFDGITNTFMERDGNRRLKYKDVVLWYPIPALPDCEDLRKITNDDNTE